MWYYHLLAATFIAIVTILFRSFAIILIKAVKITLYTPLMYTVCDYMFISFSIVHVYFFNIFF